MTDSEIFNEIYESLKFYSDERVRELFYCDYYTCDDKVAFARLDSTAFASYISALSYDRTDGEVILDAKAVVKKLQRMLTYYRINYETVRPYVRIAGDLKSGYIEYDLQNDDQTTVKITPGGWVVTPKQEKFLVNDYSLTQVEPVKTNQSPLTLFRPFVNMKGDMYVLFVVALIHAFTLGTHHAMLLLAEKGSGKSTLSKMLGRLVDPSLTNIAAIPNKADDLAVLLYNSSFCSLDNVSTINDEFSDLLCGAVTGTAIIKRKLYSNSELSILPLHNSLVINGIGVIPGKADLAERMLLFRLEKITSANRKQDCDIWEKFEKDLPILLGSIFSTLAKAMEEIQGLNPGYQPRIAQAYTEMLAIAKALGISEAKFEQIYQDNEKAKEEFRTVPVVKAVKEYMDATGLRRVTDMSEKLYRKIYDNYSGDKSLLPASASHFNRQLDEHYSDLLALGIRMNKDDSKGRGMELTFMYKKS